MINAARLRTKRVLLPAVAFVAALGAGGVVWAATANADVQGSERDRVTAAATQAVGGGTVVDAETSDDLGVSYEVEVRRPDGTEVKVGLDQDLNVVTQVVDDVDDDDGPDDTPDADDRALTASERASAEAAALAEVGGGRVVDLEASDDHGAGYEVEVLVDDHTEWEVELDTDFKVVAKTVDD